MVQAYKKLLKKLRNLIIVTLLIYLSLGIYYAIDITRQGLTTSFPWWTGFVAGLCYVIPILAVEVFSYIVTKKSFNKISEDIKEEEKK